MRPTVLDTDAYVSITQSLQVAYHSDIVNGKALAAIYICRECAALAVVWRMKLKKLKLNIFTLGYKATPIVLWTSVYPSVIVLLGLLQLVSKNVLKV